MAESSRGKPPVRSNSKGARYGARKEVVYAKDGTGYTSRDNKRSINERRLDYPQSRSRSPRGRNRSQSPRLAERERDVQLSLDSGKHRSIPTPSTELSQSSRSSDNLRSNLPSSLHIPPIGLNDGSTRSYGMSASTSYSPDMLPPRPPNRQHLQVVEGVAKGLGLSYYKAMEDGKTVTAILELTEGMDKIVSAIDSSHVKIGSIYRIPRSDVTSDRAAVIGDGTTWPTPQGLSRTKWRRVIVSYVTPDAIKGYEITSKGDDWERKVTNYWRRGDYRLLTLRSRNDFANPTGQPAMRFVSDKNWPMASYVDLQSPINFRATSRMQFYGSVNLFDLEEAIFYTTDRERTEISILCGHLRDIGDPPRPSSRHEGVVTNPINTMKAPVTTTPSRSNCASGSQSNVTPLPIPDFGYTMPEASTKVKDDKKVSVDSGYSSRDNKPIVPVSPEIRKPGAPK